MMREENHVFQGMKRDNHPIKQDGSFLWDARNIRLTNREDSTLFSITNEKGTLEVDQCTFSGNYVGHCVVGKYLVVFTSLQIGSINKSIIYRIEQTDEGYRQVTLFSGDLNLSPNHPIQTIGAQENDLIYKVYWIDDVNQPRLIIISLPEIKFGDDITTTVDKFYSGEHAIYNKEGFDFVPSLKLLEDISVTKKYGEGVFAPGTIQYAITYYNKYGQESNIVYTTPIQYISFINRGASPEDTVSNSFILTIKNVDSAFEYVRVYSIHRTSIDSVPTVKQLPDTPILNSNEEIIIVDKGTTGEIIDPSRLLYIGGRPIIAGCFSVKDNTMFLGNITLNNVDNEIRDILSQITQDMLSYDIPIRERTYTKQGNSFYTNDSSSFDLGYTGGFKTNETYRLGIQAQLDNGLWTQPVRICDDIISHTYPTINTNKPSLPYDPITYTITQYGAALNVPYNVIKSLKGLGVKKLRTCIVFPSVYDRDVVCQGILNPTVYNGYNRSKNAPFIQSSWFFRPTKKAFDYQITQRAGGNLEYRHNYALGTTNYGHEIQSMQDTTDSTIGKLIDPQEGLPNFYVDENIVTFNSPDIELEDTLFNYDMSNLKLKVVGYAQLDSIYGDINLETSSPTIGSDAQGFTHTAIGYSSDTKEENINNGGMVSQYLYSDESVTNEYKGSGSIRQFLVHAFHRDGSVNNDSNRPADKGTRTAVLSKKVISNLKFFDTVTPITNFEINGSSRDTVLDITTPQVFNSNEVALLKVPIDYLKEREHSKTQATYYGNVDSLITTNKGYNIKVLGEPDHIVAYDQIQTSKEPIRMKYKSTPHIVFGLLAPNQKQALLPRHVAFPGPGTDINYPSWLSDGNFKDFDSDMSQEAAKDYAGDLGYMGNIFTSDNQSELLKYKNRGSVYCKFNDVTMVGKVVEEEGKLVVKNSVDIAKGKVYRLNSATTIILNDDFISEPMLSAIVLSTPYTISDIEGVKIARISGEIYVRIRSNGEISRDVKPMQPTVTRSGDTPINVKYWQPTFGNQGDVIKPYLLIAELINTDKSSKYKFGGDTEQAISQNLWIPSGEPVLLNDTLEGENLEVKYSYGDTWFGRYDCLKTYPFTTEDTNQIVEIGSFMCESRINMNSRYDRNKGQLSNLNASPTNFNKINPVYNQKDNFFNYRTLGKDVNRINRFPNQITWSLEKINSQEVDLWTNTTLANTHDLDSMYGSVNSINVFNDILLCFQDSAVSQIMFNNRVQIPTSDGVPIEISNGYKVDGSRLINNMIGCTNKWSIVTTLSGIYFIDSMTSNLYLFNGQLSNISTEKGISQWLKDNPINVIWSPIQSDVYKPNGIRSFYDAKYGDVYFTPGPANVERDALCFSEQLMQFTSFMSYGGAVAMFNFNDDFYSFKKANNGLKLYKNNAGMYNYFYGEPKEWSFSFISNDNPTFTKIFDTIEIRADHYYNYAVTSLLNTCPFNFIKVSNEYQDAEATIDNYNMRKKFRVWRGLIPRNRGTMQRIRNPWSKITLGYCPDKTANAGENSKKAVVHDITVKYTI